MSSRLAQVEPRLLDFVTWSIIRGCRLFRRVHVTANGLVATESIPQYDFAAAIPCKATLSALSVMENISSLPSVQLNPSNFGDELTWWPDLTWASFCLLLYLTKAWIQNTNNGITSYLEILPFDPVMPMHKVAAVAQKQKQYQEIVKPVAASCRTTEEHFNSTLNHTYCLFRRHAIPLWTKTNGGHPFFVEMDLVKKIPRGDLLGFVPLADLAAHSSSPNTVLGIPDSEMMSFLQQERGFASGESCFVLQATRAIKTGEPITLDRNALFGFDAETFFAWFGFPWHTQVDSTTGRKDAKTARSSTPKSSPKKTSAAGTTSSKHGASTITNSSANLSVNGSSVELSPVPEPSGEEPPKAAEQTVPSTGGLNTQSL